MGSTRPRQLWRLSFAPVGKGVLPKQITRSRGQERKRKLLLLIGCKPFQQRHMSFLEQLFATLDTTRKRFYVRAQGYALVLYGGLARAAPVGLY